MFDGEKFGQEMVEIIKGYVEGQLEPLVARIDALEKRAADLEKSVKRRK